MNTVLPLPLELTQPMEMTSSLEDSLKETFRVGTMRYNPETQVRENTEGVPILYNGNGGCCGSQSSQESESTSTFLVIDLQLDIQVDDNNF